ncbi:MAG: hypothetical protein AAFY70_12260, partial [Bacteroidota bacterium]
MPDAFNHNDYENHRLKKIAEEFEDRLEKEELFFIDLVQVDELYQYYSTNGEWNRARGLIRFAIHTYPTNSGLYLKSAQIDFEQKKHEEALDGVEHALSLSPTSTDALFLQSEILSRLDRYEEAIASLARLRIFAEDPVEV